MTNHGKPRNRLETHLGIVHTVSHMEGTLICLIPLSGFIQVCALVKLIRKAANAKKWFNPNNP